MKKNNRILSGISALLFLAMFFQFCSKEENTDPYILSIAVNPDSITPNGTVTVTVYASDPNGDALSYSFTTTGGTIEPEGRSATWTAPAMAGTYEVSVVVTDGKGGEATGEGTLAVGGNTPPVISAIHVNPSTVSAEGIATVVVDASDADGDTLTYSYTVSEGSIEPDGSWAAWTAPASPGTFQVSVIVTDGKGGKATGEGALTVLGNQPPVIASINLNPSTVPAFGVVSVTVNASDPDGDTLSYSYMVSGGAIAPNGNTAIWTVSSATGAYSVSVTVKDGKGGETIGVADLTVTPPVTQITGVASFPAGTSGDLSNAKVSIYTSYDNWYANQPSKFGAVTGSGASVSFTLSDVIPGNYYLDVWKDNDNNGYWSYGDYAGWYGSGGLGSPELTEFQIAEGETFNVAVLMYIYTD